jgi:Ca2+-transporting ATPase
MKQFRLIQPEDAEVLRNKKYVRYDAASLVVGDIVRLVEGDVVPADVVILSLGMEHINDTEGEKSTSTEFDMTVDSLFVTGQTKPMIISSGSMELTTLYYGSRVLEGACIALVVSTGKQVLLARLIKDGRWPPKGDISDEIKAEESARDEEGISLMSMM